MRQTTKDLIGIKFREAKEEAKKDILDKINKEIAEAELVLIQMEISLYHGDRYCYQESIKFASMRIEVLKWLHSSLEQKNHFLFRHQPSYVPYLSNNLCKFVNINLEDLKEQEAYEDMSEEEKEQYIISLESSTDEFEDDFSHTYSFEEHRYDDYPLPSRRDELPTCDPGRWFNDPDWYYWES